MAYPNDNQYVDPAYDPNNQMDVTTGGGGFACPQVYQPVIGSDGMTYSNSCESEQAGAGPGTPVNQGGGGTQFDPNDPYSQYNPGTGGAAYGKGTWDAKSDPQYAKYLQAGGTMSYDKWLGGGGQGVVGDPSVLPPAPGEDPMYGTGDTTWGNPSPELGPSPGAAGSPGAGRSPRPRGSSWGGVSAVNPQAEAFDYDQIWDFADEAYGAARRYMDPQLKMEDERFRQDLINRGIDPDSEAGMREFMRKERAQSDMQSKAQFDALGFGAGMQQQMFDQDATRSELANALLRQSWDLRQRGHEFDNTLAQQKHEYDTTLDQLKHEYDTTLDQRQHEFDTGAAAAEEAMNWGQMMDLENLDYRDYQTWLDEGRYRDTLGLALMPWLQNLMTGGGGTNSNALIQAMLDEFGLDADIYTGAYST